MITYTTGDLLKSTAQALVNTVNCEGYMGKGIAYQFKLQFPENNADYVRACRNGSLTVGKLHHYSEKGKLIINFPTKDKWREKSKISYIDKGLDELVTLVEALNIKSLAIPPLGSGNGGLVWSDVKSLIEQKLLARANGVDILIYEPSQGFSARSTVEPKLNASALVLMEIKERTKNFSKLRLQKTAYFTDLFLGYKYFRFKRHNLGPYDYSIEIICRGIKEFQDFHNTKDTSEAKRILYNKIVSESVRNKMSELMPSIEKACQLVNSIDSDYELECLSTICFLIEEQGSLTTEQIIKGFRLWSKDKSERFSIEVITEGIERLYSLGIVDKNIVGYTIANN